MNATNVSELFDLSMCVCVYDNLKIVSKQELDSIVKLKTSLISYRGELHGMHTNVNT